jgi:DNA-binding NarL/FixJ family response regulator
MDAQAPSSTITAPQSSRLRVLIADDEPHARQGLSALLQTYPGIEVVGEVQDGRSAIELAANVHPDVLLVDVRMSTVDGIEVTRVMKAKMPEIVVVILTMETIQREAALAAGADAFVIKGMAPASLADTLLNLQTERLAT